MVNKIGFPNVLGWSTDKPEREGVWMLFRPRWRTWHIVRVSPIKTPTGMPRFRYCTFAGVAGRHAKDDWWLGPIEDCVIPDPEKRRNSPLSHLRRTYWIVR